MNKSASWDWRFSSLRNKSSWRRLRRLSNTRRHFWTFTKSLIASRRSWRLKIKSYQSKSKPTVNNTLLFCRNTTKKKMKNSWSLRTNTRQFRKEECTRKRKMKYWTNNKRWRWNCTRSRYMNKKRVSWGQKISIKKSCLEKTRKNKKQLTIWRIEETTSKT